jgi:LPS-assembly lipoprotein
MKRVLLTLMAVVLLSGCGFKPLYATGGGHSSSQALEGIEVAPVANYDGMRFRRHLQSLLGPEKTGSEALYLLQVTLDDNLDYLGIRPDDAASFGKVRVWATYVLKEKATGKVVTEGSARATSGFTIAGSQYASLYAEEDARYKALQQAAQSIARRLAVALHSSEHSPGLPPAKS